MQTKIDGGGGVAGSVCKQRWQLRTKMEGRGVWLVVFVNKGGNALYYCYCQMMPLATITDAML